MQIKHKKTTFATYIRCVLGHGNNVNICMHQIDAVLQRSSVLVISVNRFINNNFSGPGEAITPMCMVFRHLTV